MRINAFFSIIGALCIASCSPKDDTPLYEVEVVTVSSIEIEGHQEQLPILIDRNNSESPITKKINDAIWIDRLMMESYEAKQSLIPWSFDEVKHELMDSIYYFSFSGYYGRNEHSEEMLFNVKTGERIEVPDIPFHHLFESGTYGEFLQAVWVDKANAAFKEARKCAQGMDPYCAKWDIKDYQLENGELTFSLTSDCYPSAASRCNPSVKFQGRISDIPEKYFSALGRQALLQDNFTNRPLTEKMTWLNQHDQLVSASRWNLDKIDFSTLESNSSYAEGFRMGLILPDKDIYQSATNFVIPTNGFKIYDESGQVVGNLVGGSAGGHAFGPITSVALMDLNGELISELDIYAYEEIGYEVFALAFSDTKDDMIRLSGLDYWTRISDLEEQGFGLVGWQQFLVDNTDQLMGYYPLQDMPLDLMSQPLDEGSDLIMTATSTLHEISPTGNVSGEWMETEIKTYDAHPCEGGSIVNKKTGWMKLTNAGDRLVKFYTRGC